MWRIAIVLMSLGVLAGCTGGAVVFAPTPAPLDVSPARYDHPSGSFALYLPRNWSAHEQHHESLASTTFAPAQSDEPLVRVAVVNLGQVISPEALGDLMQQYQSQVRPDLDRYTEQNRQAMPDGSWRITGVRSVAGGNTQQVNTFIQRQGMLFGILEVTVPLSAARQSEIQTLINTWELYDQGTLPPASISVLAGSALAALQVVNVNTWSTAQGVFFVAGEMSNYSDQAFSNIPVQVNLLAADGSVIASATDVVMGYSLLSGNFAPFGLRFGAGQPPNATDYEVIVGNESWQSSQVIETVPPNALSWTDNTQFSQDGQLFVTGTLLNISTEAVRDPLAVATLFDARGRVIGTGFAPVTPSILPAQSSTEFTILIPDFGGIPQNYIVNVQALPCDASCP